MKSVFPFLLMVFTTLAGICQVSSIRSSVNLPQGLDECSGIAYIEEGKYLVHNDSGDDPNVYVIDENGFLQETIALQNASHIDFEDITTDDDGTVYVGDFGNNGNAREDLVIYTFHENGMDNSPNVGSITFSYPQQMQFPPASPNKRNYNCESIVWHNQKLLLFSKNDTRLNYTYVYELKDTSVAQEAKLIDSIKVDRRITSAAIDQNSDKLALLSHNSILIYDIHDDFDFEYVQEILIDSEGAEGVDWVNDSTLVVVEDGENNHGIRRMLHIEFKTPQTGKRPCRSLSVNTLSTAGLTAFIRDYQGTHFQVYQTDGKTIVGDNIERLSTAIYSTQYYILETVQDGRRCFDKLRLRD